MSSMVSLLTNKEVKKKKKKKRTRRNKRTCPCRWGGKFSMYSSPGIVNIVYL